MLSGMGSSGGFKGNPRLYQGGWLGLVLGAISAIAGHHDKKKAEKQAGADRDRELAIEEGQLDLAKKQDQRAQQLFQHYAGVYMPRERELVNDVFERPVSAVTEENRATADVRSSLAASRASGERNARRLGVNLASPAYQGLEAMRGLEEAKIEAGARTSARSRVRDLNFARQSSVLGMGTPTAASPFAGAAQSGYANAGSLAARRSAGSDASAYEAAYNYGSAVGNLIDTGLEAWRQRRAGGTVDQPEI